MNRTSAIWGFALAVIGSASYGLNPLFALPLYDMGLDALSVLFYRYGISVVLLLAVMLLKKESFRLSGKELPLTLAMSVLFAGSSACLFLSFKYMDAGLASVILFCYPMFVVLLSGLFFHEKLSPVTLLCVAVASGGICMLNQSDGAGGGISLKGMGLAVLSGFLYALYLIGVNRSVLKTMPTMKISFYVTVTGTLMFFAAAGFGARIMPIPCGMGWVDAVGLSVFPTIISILCVTKAIHIVGSTPASIIGALEPITALVVSIAVFGGTLTALNVVGILLVLGAVTLLVTVGRK